MQPDARSNTQLAVIAPGKFVVSAGLPGRAYRRTHADAESRVDVCLYMFSLCRHLESLYLDRRGLDCLFDVDQVGSMPETICRMLGAIVCELVNDVVEGAPTGGAITVTVRRQAAACVCAVKHAGSVDPWRKSRQGLNRVQRLAREIHGHCRARRLAGSRTIAVMFDLAAASDGFRRYCATRSHLAG